jgi:hypothetical protein
MAMITNTGLTHTWAVPAAVLGLLGALALPAASAGPPATQPSAPSSAAGAGRTAESTPASAPGEGRLAEDGPAGAEAVRQAVARARHFLIRQIDERTGRCRYEYDEGSSRHGLETAIVLWALGRAGERYDRNPVLRRAYAWLTARPRKHTELVALRALAAAEVSGKDGPLWRCMAEDARWLMRAASREGYYCSTSAFGRSLGAYANTYADWATMAVAAASRNDVNVPRAFWRHLMKGWLRAQLPAGGWKYAPQNKAGPQYGANLTMTAAGLCALAICDARLDDRDLCAYDRELLAQARQRGMDWLDRRFALPRPRYEGDTCYDSHRFPGRVLGTYSPGTELRWHWLLNVRRLRRLTGRRRLGGIDPCDVLASQMLKDQNDDGSWGGGTWSSGIWKVQLTAFGVLFLAEEPRPPAKKPPQNDKRGGAALPSRGPA